MTGWRAALGVALALHAVGTAACPPRTGGFRVFEALLYTGMPDLRPFGLAPIHVIDRGFWRGDPAARTGDPAKVAAVVAALPADGAPVVIDVEWPNLHRRDPGSGAAVAALARLAAQFKAAAAPRAVGIYGAFPLDDYWRAIDVPPGGAAEWRRDNDAAAAIGPHVDVTFPSLYTYFRDRAGWVRQANALVCEARRISGKPVYAFLWPEFHDSTADAGRELPADYWQLELDTLHGIADGIVIWGGVDVRADRARPWNADAPWWRVTQATLARWRLAPLDHDRTDTAR